MMDGGGYIGKMSPHETRYLRPRVSSIVTHTQKEKREGDTAACSLKVAIKQEKERERK